MKVLALIAAALAGCAALKSEVAKVQDGWLDATYDEVVLRWGTPVRSTRLTDGRNVYTWVSDGTVSRGAVYPSIGISGGTGGMGIGTGVMFGAGGSQPVRCERTLIFKDGRVAEQNWQGPAEYCSTFGRSAALTR